MIRVALSILRNLLSVGSAPNDMVVFGLMGVLEALQQRKFADEDIPEDIDFLHSTLQVNLQSLSSWDVYKTELESGKLEWSPSHKSDAFWKDNFKEFEKNECAAVKKLIEHLSSEDPQVLAIACNDISELIKHHPEGRRLLTQYGAKPLAMQVLKHPDPAVQKYALSGLHASNLGLAKTIVAVMFFALSFRSRVFSPLNASRPRVANEKLAKKQKKRPSWTPPAVVFPLVWISMGFLRSLSTMLVFAATGTVTHPAILAFVAHLSIGDTWNSINNVEKRLGVAAVGVLFVVSSAYNVVYQYYNVLPTAGYVIAPLAIWLTVATTLVWGIWNINLPREPLYPTKPSVLVA